MTARRHRVVAVLALSAAIALPAAAEDDLALRLVMAASDAERERLLSDAGATPSAEIVLAVVAQAREARLQGRVPEPVGALEHARELALRAGDDLAFAAAALEHLLTGDHTLARWYCARQAVQQRELCG